MTKSSKKSTSQSSMSNIAAAVPSPTPVVAPVAAVVPPVAEPVPTKVSAPVNVPPTTTSAPPVGNNDQQASGDAMDQSLPQATSSTGDNVQTNNIPQGSGFAARFDNIVRNVRQTQQYLREINSDLIVLNKEYQKSNKPIHKKKNMKKAGDASRSGITQEVAVSKELEKFMNLKAGEMVSRTAVTRAVTAYIKEHNLQQPTNRRNIILDATLSKLLNPPKEDQVTYFNLQRYLKVHYISSGKAPAGTESVTPAVAVASSS